MSIKGFNVNGVTEQYDYNYLDNKPETTGIPVGGTTGQVLTKVGNTDYDVAWEDPDVGADLVMVRGTGADSVISKSDLYPNVAQGQGAFAVGRSNSASGNSSIAVGYNNIASNIASIAIGGQTKNKRQNQATQDGAIALGQSNEASGYYSVAIGKESVASGVGAVAIGYGNTASGNASLAVGGSTVAGARCSAALGNGTNANGGNSLVAGKYNVIDTAQAAETTGEREFALIIGNGTDDNNRSNAMTVDWDGNAVVAGKLTVGAAPTANMDAATKQYVDNAIPTVPSPASSGTPAMDGTASRGSSTQYARADHRHPTDTSRAAASEITRIDAALATKADAATMEQDIEDAVDDWMTAQAPSIGTLSYSAKRALLNLLQHVAYDHATDIQYYNALESELFPDTTLESISAVFTQGSAVIYDTDSIETLRQYLVVTANFSDSTTEIVTSYTLSGTLTAGTSTITVSYGGKTDTFNVTVTLDRIGRFGTFTDGYTAVKASTSSQYPSYVPYCFRQVTAARSTHLTPVQNRNYVLTVTDSSKYNICVYDITSLNELEIPRITQATPSIGYSGGAKTIAWAASDSASTPYIWIALKKMDNTAFTSAELANAAEAVFTFTESA